MEIKKEWIRAYKREKILRKIRLIEISILYIFTMFYLVFAIFGATQQNSTSNVTVKYSRPTYIVTFDANGGSCSTSSKNVRLGDNFGTLPSTTRTGYNFSGWFLGGSVVSSSTQYTTIGNITLSAHWSAKTYTITLDRQSGSGGSSTVTATYNATVPSISIPTRLGYSFDGYYTGTGGSGTQYYNSSGTGLRTWTTDGGATLYAKWSAIPTTITFSAANYTERYGLKYSDKGQAVVTITAGGGGGKWKFSVISATRTYPKCNFSHGNHNSIYTDPSKCYILSTTLETTKSVTLTCNGVCCMYERNANAGRDKESVYYTYTVQAESVYNGTKATVTIKFYSTYWTMDSMISEED